MNKSVYEKYYKQLIGYTLTEVVVVDDEDDEYYWRDLLDTIEICQFALDNYDEDTEIYYESSW